MIRMRDPEEIVDLDARKPRGFLPWILFAVALAGGGYVYFGMHRPLVEEAHSKDATVADLTRQLRDAKLEAKVAKTAQAALKKAEDDNKQMREDLARSSAQKADDDKLLDQLKKQAGSSADVQGAGGQITVTMVDRILFKSGEAALTPEGEQVLRKFGGVLKETDKLIEVGGHADNTPVESARKQQFPTNWELSAARATNVVRFLQEQVGIKPRRLKAAGYGSARPIASNATERGRAKNRRIEIMLLPDKVKVVKGDFSEELAAAPPPAPAAKAAHPKVAAKKHSK
jgi:chemotaxis protein MotB